MNVILALAAFLFLSGNVDCKQDSLIHKRILENGLTVLIVPSRHTPDVAIQLYYHVGSKDENIHEKGIAHLLEHMVFKGTRELLSETDIGAVAHKLSGYCNACTSYDYTAYVFNLPTRYWHEALPILADCMTNCTFKQDILNSEFKAVVQELKMRRDDPQAALFQELLTSVFPDHPYHYPVIGFKHDIWDVKSADLHAFYRKYYTPGNATLILVGDIDPEQAFESIKKAFGSIPAGDGIERKVYNDTARLVSRASSLYCDLAQPQALLGYRIPGIKDRQSLACSVVACVLAGGTSSRLYKKIVEQERWAHAIQCHIHKFEDYSILTFQVTPVNELALEMIKKYINQELERIASDGISPEEFQAVRNALRSYRAELLENNYKLAEHIARSYLATQDEHCAFDLLNGLPEAVNEELTADIKRFVAGYCRPSQMQSVLALPLQGQDKKYWNELQEKSLHEDIEILDARIRESAVEEIRYACTVKNIPFSLDHACIPQEFTLSNGLQVVAYHNPSAQKTIVDVRLKTQPEHLGASETRLYTILSNILVRGTQKYTFEELSDAITSKGGDLFVTPGRVAASMFSEDLEPMLSMIAGILKEPLLDDEHLAKVKEYIKCSIHEFHQNPFCIASHLLSNTLYEKEIELDKQKSLDAVDAVSQVVVRDFYRQVITPHDAYMVIVGNVDVKNLIEVLERALRDWHGNAVETPSPRLQYAPAIGKILEYPMDRDQVVIALGTHSVPRTHKDFYSLALASIILFEGMDSRLFKIRQETGIFYSAEGSFIYDASYEPGFIGILTTVSPDMAHKAETLLLNLLKNCAETITDEEVERAKNVALDRFAYNYATNNAIVQTLSALKKYNEPWDDITRKVERYKSITAEQVRQAVRDVLVDKEFVQVRVGPGMVPMIPSLHP